MEKMLTVEQLRKFLSEIPDTYYLMPNAVGNLAILNNEQEYVGSINFLPEGDGVRWNEGEEPPR